MRSKYPDAILYSAMRRLSYANGLGNTRRYVNALVTALNGAGDEKVRVLDFGQRTHWPAPAAPGTRARTEHEPLAGLFADELRAEPGW